MFIKFRSFVDLFGEDEFYSTSYKFKIIKSFPAYIKDNFIDSYDYLFISVLYGVLHTLELIKEHEQISEI